MYQIIQLGQNLINGQTIDTVNARELHGFLESKQDFSTWIKSRIDKYGFDEGQDFIRVDAAPQKNGAENSTTCGWQSRIDYFLTLDMAKELAMVERNDKGKQARLYFIECEKKLRDRPMTTMEMVAHLANRAVEQEKLNAMYESQLEQHDDKIKRLETENSALKEELKLLRDEEQFFVAKAAAKLYGYNNISNQVAQKLGMALSRLSREMGYEIQKRKHCDFTEVGAYHIDVIRELFEIRGYEIYQ